MRHTTGISLVSASTRHPSDIPRGESERCCNSSGWSQQRSCAWFRQYWQSYLLDWRRSQGTNHTRIIYLNVQVLFYRFPSSLGLPVVYSIQPTFSHVTFHDDRVLKCWVKCYSLFVLLVICVLSVLLCYSLSLRHNWAVVTMQWYWIIVNCSVDCICSPDRWAYAWIQVSLLSNCWQSNNRHECHSTHYSVDGCAEQSINRAFVNGSVSEHVVDFDLESPDGVVVDWLAHNVYWVDSGTQRVEMSHVDGSSRRVIVWRNVQPRSLAVDPTHGSVNLQETMVTFCSCPSK